MSYVITGDNVHLVKASVISRLRTSRRFRTPKLCSSSSGVTVVPDFVANVGTNAWWWWVAFCDIEPTARGVLREDLQCAASPDHRICCSELAVRDIVSRERRPPRSLKRSERRRVAVPDHCEIGGGGSMTSAEVSDDPHDPLEALFAPTSVAVIGASDDIRKWGNWLAKGALAGPVPVHLVNARADWCWDAPQSRR